MDNKVANEIQGRELLRAMSTTIAQKVAVCAAHVLLKDGATVLDAGCADGLATAWFAQSNPKINVIGLDYDAQFIEQARNRYAHLPNLEFIEADLRNFDLAGRPLDAILNLSILHEPYSYTGYRTRTVEEILTAELKNLSPGGIIINRDFVLPPEPEKFVYLALQDNGASGDTPETMSHPDLLRLYASEAMAFDNGDPDGHIKGFFLEEHTQRVDRQKLGLNGNWRIFYLPHGFAWEFIWRKEYGSRFYPEANEKYGYWNAAQHRAEGEKLGSRVLFSAPYENPWILENWYAPKVKLFDRQFNLLPLPPSNFICVMQKPAGSTSFFLREHRQAKNKPSFLQMSHFVNTTTAQRYDLVKRPGTDVVDVIPWQANESGEIFIYAKCDYPRPMVNTQSRRMTANLDGKIWSGHMIEPLAAAPMGDWQTAVNEVLLERAGFAKEDIGAVQRALTYYTAPADLDERVQSACVEITGTRIYDRPLDSHYSGFSHDGSVRGFDALRLLQAIQVGMLAEARLELNLYNLLRQLNKPVGDWIGGKFTPGQTDEITLSGLDKTIAAIKTFKVFRETGENAGWLDIVRSEFHERELRQNRERVMAKRELEFVVPNPLQSQDVSTNSVTVIPIIAHAGTGRLLVGLQKIHENQSQFPAVQTRENYSGHITVPGIRLPSSIEHIQQVPEWIAQQINVPAFCIKKLGESYFPSLGVLPNRVFPFVVTEVSDSLRTMCDFYCLRKLVTQLDKLRDAHTMIAVCRLAHALGQWPYGDGK